jgi:septum formation protein
MLTLLSGNTHKVITGTTVGTQKSSTTFHDLTFVTFADMRPEEMEFYIDTFKPFDKAGAYGIQEWIGHVILQKIDGSFTNVMGLPVQMLYDILKKSFPELTKFMIP